MLFSDNDKIMASNDKHSKLFPNHFNATILKATIIFENPQVKIMDLPSRSENNLTSQKAKINLLSYWKHWNNIHH